ncbi:hypothetical protein Tco_1581361, partial [Tanacetum coccineum]
MDGGEDGDDDDGDSHGDDTDEEDEEEEEEYLALADSDVVVPTASISLPPEAEVERLLAMPTPPPSPPISLSPPSARERLAMYTTPSAHSSPPPVPSPLLPSSGCLTQIQTLMIASTQALVDAITAALPSPPLLPYSRVRAATSQEIMLVDQAEAVLEIAPMTMGEVNSRVTELAERHEHDIQDLYALLDDAQDSRTRISQREEAYASREAWSHAIGLSQAVHYEVQTHHEQQAEMAELRETDRRRQAQMVETLRVMRDIRREMGDMQ